MPEIALTETQYRRLEAVREDVEAAFVDNYGRVPIEDAIEYLLDTYTPPGEDGAADAYKHVATAEYPQLQRVASEVPAVPGSGIDADEMRGKLLAELGIERFAAKLSEAATAETDGPQTDPVSVDENAGTATASASDPVSKDDASAAAGSETADSSEPVGRSAGQTGETGGDSPLATANRLLTEHDENWREGGGDEPYEVDLPDGTTESVRTKDDVRQLLFRHY
jgi:hypothetical protein